MSLSPEEIEKVAASCLRGSTFDGGLPPSEEEIIRAISWAIYAKDSQDEILETVFSFVVRDYIDIRMDYGILLESTGERLPPYRVNARLTDEKLNEATAAVGALILGRGCYEKPPVPTAPTELFDEATLREVRRTLFARYTRARKMGTWRGGDIAQAVNEDITKIKKNPQGFLDWCAERKAKGFI